MRHLAFGAFLLITAAGCAQQPPEIAGEYIEGRSNHVFGCYCEWSGEMVTGGTEAVMAWQIRSGEYAGVPLGGVRFAAVIVGESTLSMGNAPRKSVLIVDRAASAAQRQAVERLARDRYAGLLGTVLRIQSLPIEFDRGAEKAVVRIGDLVHVAMRKARLPEDALQGATLWYSPFIPMTESILGITLNSRYSGDAFDHRWNNNSDFGVTGYFGTFRLVAGAAEP